MGKTLRNTIYGIMMGCGLAALTGCGDDGCTESTSSFTVASLKAADGTSPVPPSSLSVYGVGQQNDSAMILSSTSFNGISLLLNPDTTFTKMIFVFPFAEADTLRDTLSFYYKNQLYFLTIDCGCTVQNYLDSITHTTNLIDSIEIVNPEVTNEKKPNITLYY